MNPRIKFLAFAVGVVFFISILRYIRKRSFNPSYSVLWLGISAFLVSISVLEPFYQWLTYSIIGLVDARHIIYIVLIGFLLVYCLYLTSKITRMSDQIQNLISYTAILGKKLNERNKK